MPVRAPPMLRQMAARSDSTVRPAVSATRHAPAPRRQQSKHVRRQPADRALFSNGGRNHGVTRQSQRCAGLATAARPPSTVP